MCTSQSALRRHNLDKLAQVGTSPSVESVDTLQFVTNKATKASDSKTISKRARSKYYSLALKDKLCTLEDSPLFESYQKSCSCSSTISVSNGDARATYCKQRWCLTCCRIKMGSMINNYLPLMKEYIKDPYFVTLTVPNVSAEVLRDTLLDMFATLSKIKNKLNKRYNRDLRGFRRTFPDYSDEQVKDAYSKDNTALRRFSGIVKAECTYNADTDSYHPHFHCVIEDEGMANELKNSWLSHYPDASPKAQDVQKADDNSMKELLKYSVKMMSDIVDSNGEKSGAIYVKALDIMFDSMRGIRLFRTFGDVYNVKIDEEMTDEEMNVEEAKQLELELDDNKRPSDGCYVWFGHDWVNVETGELLCRYEPSDKDRKFLDKLVL